MNKNLTLTLSRFLALSLAISLALPNPAWALRQLNAGMEESPINGQLRARLGIPDSTQTTNSLTGMEETKTLSLDPTKAPTVTIGKAELDRLGSPIDIIWGGGSVGLRVTPIQGSKGTFQIILGVRTAAEGGVTSEPYPLTPGSTLATGRSVGNQSYTGVIVQRDQIDRLSEAMDVTRLIENRDGELTVRLMSGASPTMVRYQIGPAPAKTTPTTAGPKEKTTWTAVATTIGLSDSQRKQVDDALRQIIGKENSEPSQAVLLDSVTISLGYDRDGLPDSTNVTLPKEVPIIVGVVEQGESRVAVAFITQTEFQTLEGQLDKAARSANDPTNPTKGAAIREALSDLNRALDYELFPNQAILIVAKLAVPKTYNVAPSTPPIPASTSKPMPENIQKRLPDTRSRKPVSYGKTAIIDLSRTEILAGWEAGTITWNQAVQATGDFRVVDTRAKEALEAFNQLLESGDSIKSVRVRQTSGQYDKISMDGLPLLILQKKVFYDGAQGIFQSTTAGAGLEEDIMETHQASFAIKQAEFNGLKGGILIVNGQNRYFRSLDGHFFRINLETGVRLEPLSEKDFLTSLLFGLSEITGAMMDLHPPQSTLQAVAQQGYAFAIPSIKVELEYTPTSVLVSINGDKAYRINRNQATNIASLHGTTLSDSTKGMVLMTALGSVVLDDALRPLLQGLDKRSFFAKLPSEYRTQSAGLEEKGVGRNRLETAGRMAVTDRVREYLRDLTQFGATIQVLDPEMLEQYPELAPLAALTELSDSILIDRGEATLEHLRAQNARWVDYYGLPTNADRFDRKAGGITVVLHAPGDESFVRFLIDLLHAMAPLKLASQAEVERLAAQLLQLAA